MVAGFRSKVIKNGLAKTGPMAKILIGFLLAELAIWGGRPAQAVEPESYVVVISDAPPFRLVERWDGAGEFSGVFVDATAQISERTGLNLVLKDTSYSQALSMIGDGRADMMLGTKWTPQQTLFMDYLRTWFPAEPTVFFLASDQPDIWSYTDLKDLKIGVLEGVGYFDPLDRDALLRKIAFPNYEDAFTALENREINTVLSPQRQGLYQLKQMGLSFKVATYHDPGQPSYITISKRSPLIEKRGLIEGVLVEMQRERYFERLLEIYDF